MELEELQRRVDAWIHEYGVRYFSELTNMACLTEEVGELARVMARRYGDQSFKAGDRGLRHSKNFRQITNTHLRLKKNT